MCIITIEQKLLINKHSIEKLYNNKIFKRITSTGKSVEIYRDYKLEYKVVHDGELVMNSPSVVLSVDKFNSYFNTSDETNYWKGNTTYTGFL